MLDYYSQRISPPTTTAAEAESGGFLPHQNSEQFNFLNKALIAQITNIDEFVVWLMLKKPRLDPMERTIFSGFKIPAASLRCIIGLVILTFIPIYDRIFCSDCNSYLVEIKRLKTAKEYNLVETPSSTIPMSIWWLVPQYLLLGIADVFPVVGLQEFFLSSFLVLVIDKATGGNGRDSWFSSNLNRVHLDYFYWLLARLGAIEFVAYLYFARSYIFNGRVGAHGVKRVEAHWIRGDDEIGS
ncbi:hypothetical protein TIFTF001_020952 [Ficus carica]|uniref:Uncharacterized protein n=1 Tax=Ficus carica TaxID=3494 RepID=A0AA88DBE5_FICCA|nr:hypothetical protein TIFTF001_020952 [Ficus carica]